MNNDIDIWKQTKEGKTALIHAIHNNKNKYF